MKEQLEEKFGPCGKLLYYFKHEFNYDPYDLVKEFDEDFMKFMEQMKKRNLLNPQQVTTQQIMEKEIDNFMLDVKQYTRRKSVIFYKT